MGGWMIGCRLQQQPHYVSAAHRTVRRRRRGITCAMSGSFLWSFRLVSLFCLFWLELVSVSNSTEYWLDLYVLLRISFSSPVCSLSSEGKWSRVKDFCGQILFIRQKMNSSKKDTVWSGQEEICKSVGSLRLEKSLYFDFSPGLQHNLLWSYEQSPNEQRDEHVGPRPLVGMSVVQQRTLFLTKQIAVLGKWTNWGLLD